MTLIDRDPEALRALAAHYMRAVLETWHPAARGLMDAAELGMCRIEKVDVMRIRVMPAEDGK